MTRLGDSFFDQLLEPYEEVSLRLRGETEVVRRPSDVKAAFVSPFGRHVLDERPRHVANVTDGPR